MIKRSILALCVAVLAFTSCKTSKYPELKDGIYADMQTSMGDMLLRLEYDKVPVTVANFVSLAEGTNTFVADSMKKKPFYDGLIFHRVIEDFMIQGGDPTGTGRGNPGYRFADEFNDSLRHDEKGVLSMANSGPNTNGSQFFITRKPTPWLDNRHSVFGKLVAGMDVLDSIAAVETDPADRPLTPVVINTLDIIRKGEEARKFDAVEVLTGYFREKEERDAEMAKMKADIIASFATQWEEAEVTPSGLRIFTLVEGEGEQPEEGQQVLINYAGWLYIDGKLFDSNIRDLALLFDAYNPQREARGMYRPLPFDFSSDSGVIPGFKEGLLTMKVGDKKRLFIPSHLGYGEQGAGNVIPPGSDLVFELEMVEIVEDKE